jgi:hypothetical protein
VSWFFRLADGARNRQSTLRQFWEDCVDFHPENPDIRALQIVLLVLAAALLIAAGWEFSTRLPPPRT